jgi:hypothetical protein
MSARRRLAAPGLDSAECGNVEIKRSNPLAFETIGLRLKQLAGLQAKVGWFEDAKYDNGTPVAYVAAIQELGHGPIPPRPFMRPTANEKRQDWADLAGQAIKSVIKGESTPTQAMVKLAQQSENDVRKKILSIHTPPLSPITIELRAMRKRNPSLVVGGKIVGEVAAKVKGEKYKTPTGVSIKPLVDTRVLITKLTHVVEKS